MALSVSTGVNASSWGQATTISGYYVYATGSAYFKVSTPLNPDSCTSTQYIYLDTSQAFFKELWATIISAYMSATTVSVYYDGCVGPYPRASSIAVPANW
jgi:hypothetical protein